MTVWIALLILLGTVAAMALICERTVHFKSKRQNDAYDERQKIYQGKANGFGLGIGVIYFGILSTVLLIMGERKLTADLLSMLIWAGILLAYTAVNFYCLMTDTLLPLNGAMDPVLGLSYAFAIMKLIHLFVYICVYGMSMGDDPIDTWEDLMGLVFWTLHAVMYMIAKRREKRDADGQE